MINKGPSVSPVLAATIISLLVGAAAGYYVRFFQASDKAPPASQSGMAGGGRMGGGGGGAPGGGMPGGGFGGGQPTPASTLARLVRNLNTMEQMQNKELSPEQKNALRPIIAQLKGADKLSEQQCEAHAAAIQKILAEPQKQALESLQPPRGGGGGGGMGGGGRPGGGMQPSVGGMTGGMGGGMGQRPDPERPFASDRDRTALDALASRLQTR